MNNILCNSTVVLNQLKCVYHLTKSLFCGYRNSVFFNIFLATNPSVIITRNNIWKIQNRDSYDKMTDDLMMECRLISTALAESRNKEKALYSWLLLHAK